MKIIRKRLDVQAIAVVEFRVVDCILEYRPDDTAEWVVLGNVCGDDGIDGSNGTNGTNGTNCNCGNDPEGLPSKMEFAESECVSFPLTVDARRSLQVPTVVKAGYIIDCWNVLGAVMSGESIYQLTVANHDFWFAPNGQNYSIFDPHWWGDVYYDANDPLPEAPHMCLLVKIGDVYYSAVDNPTITVPEGTLDTTLVFLVNDSILDDNEGTFTLELQICAPGEAVAWCHSWDYIDGSNWLTPVNGAMQHIIGEGWRSPLGGDVMGQWDGLIGMGEPAVLSSLVAHYGYTGETLVNPEIHIVMLDASDQVVGTHDQAFDPGDIAVICAFDPVTCMSVQIYFTGLSDGDPGEMDVTDIRMAGTGVSWWGNNC